MLVIPNGFDFSKLEASPEERQKLREQCGMLDRHLVIGSLARFNTAKDQRTFIAAAAIVAAEAPDARFLMVGPEISRDNAELWSWIMQTGYQDRFILLGERTDIAACLSAMDVFCLHSRTEGFPNVLGEAMALARPSVTTDVGDAAMLLGDTGRVVPKNDPVQLAQRLLELSRMPEGVRSQMGKRACDRVRSHFDIQSTRNGFETLYEEVMAYRKGLR